MRTYFALWFHCVGTIAKLCRAIYSQLRRVSTIGKIVKQQYLRHMPLQYGELRPTNGWDLLVSLGHPSKFPRVSYFGSVTARHSSSGHQRNFAALNRRLDLYSEGWPSRSAFAHILVKNVSWPWGWNLAISITLTIGFYNNCCARHDWQWKASFDCVVHELWWYGLSVVDWTLWVPCMCVDCWRCCWRSERSFIWCTWHCNEGRLWESYHAFLGWCWQHQADKGWYACWPCWMNLVVSYVNRSQ